MYSKLSPQLYCLRQYSFWPGYPEHSCLSIFGQTAQIAYVMAMRWEKKYKIKHIHTQREKEKCRERERRNQQTKSTLNNIRNGSFGFFSFLLLSFRCSLFHKNSSRSEHQQFILIFFLFMFVLLDIRLLNGKHSQSYRHNGDTHRTTDTHCILLSLKSKSENSCEASTKQSHHQHHKILSSSKLDMLY